MIILAMLATATPCVMPPSIGSVPGYAVPGATLRIERAVPGARPTYPGKVERADPSATPRAAATGSSSAALASARGKVETGSRAAPQYLVQVERGTAKAVTVGKVEHAPASTGCGTATEPLVPPQILKQLRAAVQAGQPAMSRVVK